MRPASILLVDDDPDILEALSEIMTEEGFFVRVARNGQEALDLVGAVPPVLILLDLMMPVMDGREFGARIRSCPDWADIPIIVLSADRDPQTAAEELDAAGCLAKPFELDALVGLVRSVVSPVTAVQRTPTPLRSIVPKQLPRG
jgi:CheY-like chemotaxis protein